MGFAWYESGNGICLIWKREWDLQWYASWNGICGDMQAGKGFACYASGDGICVICMWGWDLRDMQVGMGLAWYASGNEICYDMQVVKGFRVICNGIEISNRMMLGHWGHKRAMGGWCIATFYQRCQQCCHYWILAREMPKRCFGTWIREGYFKLFI